MRKKTKTNLGFSSASVEPENVGMSECRGRKRERERAVASGKPCGGRFKHGGNGGVIHGSFARERECNGEEWRVWSGAKKGGGDSLTRGLKFVS